MSRDTSMLATANQWSTFELPRVKPLHLHDTTSSVPVPGSFRTNTLGTKAGTAMSLFSSETVNCTPDELRHNMIYTKIRTLVRYDISEVAAAQSLESAKSVSVHILCFFC